MKLACIALRILHACAVHALSISECTCTAAKGSHRYIPTLTVLPLAGPRVASAPSLPPCNPDSEGRMGSGFFHRCIFSQSLQRRKVNV